MVVLLFVARDFYPLSWDEQTLLFNQLPEHFVKQGQRKRLVKNGDDRLVVLNQAAKAVIEQARGINQDYVFSYIR